MKFSIHFQHLPTDASRPIDHPTHSDFEVGENGFALIPSVGDFVQIIPIGHGDGAAEFDGRVRSRLFRFFDNKNCVVNIVIEDSDEDWGKLIKE